MKFFPLFDRVLIKPIENKNANQFGLVLSEVAKTRPDKGVVVCVGEGLNFDYDKCKMCVKVGDKVLFNRFAGAEVEVEEEKYLVLRQIDIVGVYGEREDNC